jgi:RNA polymerase sigma-B factor
VSSAVISTGEDRRQRSFDEYQHLQPLLERFARLPTDDPARRAIRNELVLGYLPLAKHLAARYRRSPAPWEELAQVAAVGLIKSLDRYNPALGCDFVAYAVPTIRGELRRYFRDCTWSMRVPRRVKELYLAVREVSGELAAELHRAPRPSELAQRLEVSIEEVLEALHAGEVYNAVSSDWRVDFDDCEGSTSLSESFGEIDSRFELVEFLQSLPSALARLTDREVRILVLRFRNNMTQTQIAEQLGVSQMHISRILQQTFTKLRQALDGHSASY